MERDSVVMERNRVRVAANKDTSSRLPLSKQSSSPALASRTPAARKGVGNTNAPSGRGVSNTNTPAGKAVSNGNGNTPTARSVSNNSTTAARGVANTPASSIKSTGTRSPIPANSFSRLSIERRKMNREMNREKKVNSSKISTNKSLTVS